MSDRNRFQAYALGFWYGWTLTTEEDFTVGKIILVFFSIIIAVFSLGNASQYAGILASAKGAGYEVFRIIDRKSKIDPETNTGQTPIDFIADIEFKDVSFEYPSRDQVKILNNISFKINSGSTVALVGSSGCGKSTCIQLIERFYDSSSGTILIGDTNIKDLNLNWLRSQLGVVNQEPILFGTSIIENIKYGKQDATNEEIIEAAKKANAHNFIMKLPKKYDTLVGDRGSQLSGGQKQRIAIARALVRNPKILLLDEATSALDNESESIVQQALDKARMGRTTVIVAHRLSTIRNADLIYCLKAGQIVESGSHTELMNLKGHYYSLVINQENSQGFTPEETTNVLERLKSIQEDQDLEEVKITSDSKKEESKEKKTQEPNLMRVLALNKPEWFFILIGCLACIVSGAANPAFSIVFSKVIAVFQECDPQKQKDGVILYCLIFIGIGVTTFFSNFIMSAMFAVSGENMTKRLRSECFKTMLQQDLEWFDKEENNVGALTTRLSVEAAAVQGATGPKLGNILMNIANLGVGIVIAFISSWVISLVIIAFIPLTIVAGILKTKLLTGYINQDKKCIEEAGKITNESISNIKTVAILNKEKYFSNEYSNIIDIPYKASIKSAHIFGFMLGFSSSIFYYAIAASFVLGAYLIEQKKFDLTFEKIMRVFSVLIFGAQSVGQAASMMPDYAKAKVAIQKIFELFDRVPTIDNWNTNTGCIPDESFETDINLDSIDFSYPNRSTVKVLDKLNVNIKQGQKIALVGSSGCGKSTVTQLLERFYDPLNGSIKIGGIDIRQINLEWLRYKISIVSQEPLLLDASIADNIAYGDNSRQVQIEEIIEAAKLANIHDFITSLPMGYNTNVGSKGTQLSGGQKQRVSIARALIRNPKILLLDEATSALDTESEKIVQEALDKAQEGRTCIIIAHRLSTIRNCDVIFVIKNGKVSEIGTHDELMKMNGFYAKLNRKTPL